MESCQELRGTPTRYVSVRIANETLTRPKAVDVWTVRFAVLSDETDSNSCWPYIGLR